MISPERNMVLAKISSNMPRSGHAYKQMCCFNYQGRLSHTFPKLNTLLRHHILKFSLCQGLPSGRFVSETGLEKSLRLSGLIIVEVRVCPQQLVSLPLIFV